jgi:hypothetical protein
MFRLSVAVAFTFAVGLTPSLHAGTIVLAASDFATTSQNWSAFSFGYSTPFGQPNFSTSVGGSSAVTHNVTGGNPDGFIQITDPDSGNEYFVAGTGYSGDFSAAYGGFFTFDEIRLDSNDLPLDSPVLPLIALTDGNLTLVYANTFSAPSSAWQSYAIPLSTDLPGWFIGTTEGTAANSLQLRTVLSNLQSTYILGDWFVGQDSTGLDNISMSATPEPGTMWMAVPFLLFFVRRRAR